MRTHTRTRTHAHTRTRTRTHTHTHIHAHSHSPASFRDEACADAPGPQDGSRSPSPVTPSTPVTPTPSLSVVAVAFAGDCSRVFASPLASLISAATVLLLLLALPTRTVATPSTYFSGASSSWSSCVVDFEGKAKCWGWNDKGPLGHGTTNRRGDTAADFMGDLLLAFSVTETAGVTIKAIFGSTKHVCAHLSDLSIKCWGFNAYGQRCVGDANDLSTPSLLPAAATASLGTGRTALNVSAGDDFNCALLDDAKVKCWGVDTNGYIGNGGVGSFGTTVGTIGDNLPYVDLGTGRTVVLLASGIGHTCVVLDNASTKCWGANSNGQLGLGDVSFRGDGPFEMGDNLSVVNLGTGRTPVMLAGGGSHMCAVFSDSAVKCWGLNGNGQLGLGDSNDRGDNSNEMGDNLAAVDLGTGGLVVSAMSAGSAFTCALFSSGAVKCWGANSAGQLGLGDANNRGDGPNEMGDNLPFVSLGTGRTAVTIAAGDSHVCAKLDNSKLKCWGASNYGQLGLLSTFNRGDNSNEMGDFLPFVNLGSGVTIGAIFASGAYTCATVSSTAALVKCWGFNQDSQQLMTGDNINRGDGPGNMGDILPTTDLGTGRSIVAIVGKEHGFCATLDNGQLKCWGANDNGRFGTGGDEYRGDDPNEMGDSLAAALVGTGRSVTSASLGYDFACALLDNAKVKCWGASGDGQLGLGSTSEVSAAGSLGDNLAYVNLGTGISATAISSGQRHTCVLLSTSGVKCWGKNDFGQLGQGDTDNRGDGGNEMGDSLPEVNLGTGLVVSAIACGEAHVCALFTTGSVKCWGFNGNCRPWTLFTLCTSCAPGQYNADASQPCLASAAAAYAPTALTSSCTACAAGRFAERQGAQACTACPAGSASAAVAATSSATCVACAAGSFAAGAGSTSCVACAAGSFASGTGASACTPCPAGTNSSAAGASAAGACEACPAGRWSAAGAAACSACAAGSFGDGAGGCSPCPAGTSSGAEGAASAAACAACPAGRWSAGGAAACSACAAGSFGNATGAASAAAGCFSCAAGSFQDQAGQTGCVACDAGKFGALAGAASATACVACAAGSFAAAAGGTACEACPAGRYADAAGQAACAACAAGKWSGATGAASATTCGWRGRRRACRARRGFVAGVARAGLRPAARQRHHGLPRGGRHCASRWRARTCRARRTRP
jgi:alpha-tubulin suppressor-like RCC1 family protein